LRIKRAVLRRQPPAMNGRIAKPSRRARRSNFPRGKLLDAALNSELSLIFAAARHQEPLETPVTRFPQGDIGESGESGDSPAKTAIPKKGR
jgi:hypothetical protein